MNGLPVNLAICNIVNWSPSIVQDNRHNDNMAQSCKSGRTLRSVSSRNSAQNEELTNKRSPFSVSYTVASNFECQHKSWQRLCMDLYWLVVYTRNYLCQVFFILLFILSLGRYIWYADFKFLLPNGLKLILLPQKFVHTVQKLI